MTATRGELRDVTISVVCGVLLVAWGVAMGASACHSAWQRASVNRGVARYHPTTGEWEWTVPLKQETK